MAAELTGLEPHRDVLGKEIAGGNFETKAELFAALEAVWVAAHGRPFGGGFEAPRESEDLPPPPAYVAFARESELRVLEIAAIPDRFERAKAVGGRWWGLTDAERASYGRAQVTRHSNLRRKRG
jgi:hypothetical protein